MKNFFFTIAVLTSTLFAQLSAPIVEEVYGGRINAITGFQLNADSSRIFIATESANSIFYADVYANATTPVFNRFYVMPGVDATAGYGSNIQKIAAHQTSGNVFFLKDNKIFATNPSSTFVNIVYTAFGVVDNLLIIDDYLFFLNSGNLRFGTLDASGNFTEDSASPISTGISLNPSTIFKNPVTDQLYVFAGSTSPQIVKFSDNYYSMSATTTLSTIIPTTLSTLNWKNFGIGPDGRLFIVGDDETQKFVAYSDDESTWTEFNTIGGVSGNSIAFSGSSTDYYVYIASIYSNYKGESGTWQGFGVPGGMETHPNDGDVYSDPNNLSIVYMTTDQGIGASIDNGSTIFEIDEGVEAVQVNDFSMTIDKQSAWIAAKSGLRKVVNYLTTPMWTNAIFPDSDGSPYYSIEMSREDTNRVFAGNLRVYRSIDNGNNWAQVFTPESAPYNFPSIGTMINAIEECSFSPNIVMAGVEIWETQKGGLFVSEDNGINWAQIYLETSTDGEDVDVADIIFSNENGDTVAYVGAIYDLALPQGRSVYRVVKNGTSWVAAQDMDASGTSVGYPITATIQDLVATSTGDTIYATGTDAGINHPITYYKSIYGTNLWTTMTTAGYPFSYGKQSTAVTVGIDTIYVAVDNEIYYFPLGASSWSLGYSYPNGTRINFLYYDELLAGTSFGLYGHLGTGSTDIGDEIASNPNEFRLSQNYPNPFNPSTEIKFSIPQNSHVKLELFNALGEKVATLLNEEMSAGSHNYQLSISNYKLSSGVYFYRLQSGNYTETKKMMLVK